MSKQRRRRLNRNKHTRSRRSFIRNGVEQLESRVLPGGFLDLLAGAAFASNFDLLPEEQLVPEEIESESAALAGRPQLANAWLLADFALFETELAPRQERAESAELADDMFITSNVSSTRVPLLATSIIDSFFASNQLVDASPTRPISQSPPLPNPSRTFSSPISQLGAGIGTGSGQGYNVTGAELPQSNIDRSGASAPTVPAWMMGEGEGGASASGTTVISSSGSGTTAATGTAIASSSASGTTTATGTATASGSGTGATSASGTATSSASGSGSATTTVSATATASGSGTAQTVSSCEGVPTVAGPSVIRFGSTTTGTPQPDGWVAPWITLDDVANEGVVLGNPAWDEADDFMTPIGIPFNDQSFLAWAEVSQHRSYVEWVLGTSRGNGELVPRDLAFKWTHSESHASINTTSASVSAGIKGQLGSIGAEVSATLQTNVSASSSVEEQEKFPVAACSVKSLYDQYEITEVQVEYVFYHDNGIFGFSKEHATITIVSSKYLGNTTKVAPGKIVTHTMTV